MQKEQWRQLQTSHGNYFASNQGRIKTITPPGREIILTQWWDKNNQKYVLLLSSTIKKRHLVHKLVMGAFKPTINVYPVIFHVDGDLDNNHIDNLEYIVQAKPSTDLSSTH